MKKYTLLLICILTNTAIASEEITTITWKGEGELGFTSTSGNTNSESLNAKLGIEKTKQKWTNKAKVETLKASTEGVHSSDSLIVTARSEYKFAERAYVFTAMRHENDKFSGFDFQTSISFGVGNQFIKNEIHELNASTGVGYRRLKETLTQIIANDAIIYINLDYLFNISKHASFMEKILVESGDSNTHTESETSLKMQVSGNLSSKISYTIKQNSDVPAGSDKFDRITTITLVYGF